MSEPSNFAIVNADLDWFEVNGVSVPFSKQFGDVYFSRVDGLAETRHVFLNGNDLPERLAKLKPHQYFCVGETGFGTGLNILALWQLWRQCRPDNYSRLHVISTEKFPLSKTDLTHALKAWPELAELSEKLLAQYPPALPGCHRLIFKDERFSLDLWLGDAAFYLPQIQTHHPVDAWFMDGFAPACNPDLWQENILANIIRLSGYGTTFASFSVAGVVKQGLRAHGITVTRPRGFKWKREMLKAWWANPLEQSAKAPTNSELSIEHRLPSIAIIGAGIAGLSIAHALASRGIACTLYDQQSPLAGASGNPKALLAPKLVSVEKFDQNLMGVSWLHCLRYWQQYADIMQCSPLLQWFDDKKETTQREQVRAYPPYVLEEASNIEGSLRSNIALHDHVMLFKQTGMIQPHRLAELILASPLIQFQQADIAQLTPQQHQWHLLDQNKKQVSTVDHVIICTARHSHLLAPSLPTLRAIRGQVSWMPLEQNPLTIPISYGGYAAPFHQDGQDALILGASFVRGDEQSDIREADHLHNLQLLQEVAPEFASQLPPVEQWQGRASIRAQSMDYLPLVGAVPAMSQVWTICGLGSKGFSFAPLCAEMLCAELLGEVMPVPSNAIQAVRAGRFYRATNSRSP